MRNYSEKHIADGRPGRKPAPTRHVLEVVLWILNTGAQWHILPQSYPDYKTVHRRFQDLMLQRDFASGFDGRCHKALSAQQPIQASGTTPTAQSKGYSIELSLRLMSRCSQRIRFAVMAGVQVLRRGVR
jgi:transposase